MLSLIHGIDTKILYEIAAVKVTSFATKFRWIPLHNDAPNQLIHVILVSCACKNVLFTVCARSCWCKTIVPE